MNSGRMALLSVSDKTGVAEFGRELTARGWTIISTGGTAAELREAGVEVRDVSDVTGFPEMLGGRVRTLHPAVHAGLLARRSVPSDLDTLARAGMHPIDLVAVNLYPFRETVGRVGVTLAEAIEQIDIGGPTLLRAAAKNYEAVWPLCDPGDYQAALEALDGGRDASDLRRRLATKVFLHTSAYDAAIAGYLTSTNGTSGLPASDLTVSLTRVQDLRYGENPDQQAAFYREASSEPWGVAGLKQLHGKELSYNNLLDVDGALFSIAPFLSDARPACAILKHTTPCGIAVGRSTAEAFELALACDPVSAFGSTIAFNQPLAETVAEALNELFVECLVAPGYAEGALRILTAKKNLRILAPAGGRMETRPGHALRGVDVRGIEGGLLLQTSPAAVSPLAVSDEEVEIPTSRSPDAAERDALGFAWAAAQSVKSNAIVLARDGRTIGIGAGQMSRVDSVKLAAWKAAEAGHDTEGSVLASDAFFPFRDGVDAAADIGVRAIVQPGGSVRDPEVVEAADDHGMAMVLTGRRLFRH